MQQGAGVAAVIVATMMGCGSATAQVSTSVQAAPVAATAPVDIIPEAAAPVAQAPAAAKAAPVAQAGSVTPVTAVAGPVAVAPTAVVIPTAPVVAVAPAVMPVAVTAPAAAVTPVVVVVPVATAAPAVAVVPAVVVTPAVAGAPAVAVVAVVPAVAIVSAVPAIPGAAGDPAAPVAPKGLVASLVLPAKDANGWATPNRGLSAVETMWHLRVALNVAALNCRGPGEAATVAGYNALLAKAKTVLDAARTGTEAAYRTRAGAAWQARYDGDMTRLYNFWAQPAAQAAFCKAADAVLLDTATIDPVAFDAAAPATLAALEQPFLEFFAAADQYRTAMVAWTATQTKTPVALAVNGPLP